MIINGVNLPDPDVGNPDFLEKFENAQQACVDKFNKAAAGVGKWSEKIRSQCIAVFEFFEEAFGAGTAKKIFGESVNLKVCIDAYADAYNGIKSLDKDLGAYFRSKGQNFNREQRRNFKKHHKKNHKK